MRLLACLIVAPQRGYDEPAILSYAISSFCPTSADGLHSRRAIQSLVITLLMIYLSGVGDRGSCDRRSPNGALWNIARDRLHWLDVGRPDHLAPFLGFVG